MLKTALLALSFTLAMHSNSLAQTVNPERLELARNYLAVTQNETMIRDMVRQNSELIVSQIKARQPEITDGKESRIRTILEENFFSAAKEAHQNMDVVIAQHFTVNELKALKIFAESETGRSVLSKLPQLSVAVQPRLQKTMASTLAKVSAELRKEGVTLIP